MFDGAFFLGVNLPDPVRSLLLWKIAPCYWSAFVLRAESAWNFNVGLCVHLVASIPPLKLPLS